MRFFKRNNPNPYLKYYKAESVDEYSFLLEAGQGKNINGNMFAFLSELRTQKEWDKYKVYWVVTEDTREAAQERTKFYGYANIKFVDRASNEYPKLLASCKYLLTDNSFPPYYMKKEGQVVLNTWHGTPLKILGRHDIKDSASFANIQKNYAMSDYVLFPNIYTRDIFMEDYSLDNLMQNKVVLADYPRNISFYNEDRQKEIRRKYSLEGKQVMGYLPTWRGASRQADINKQKMITKDYLQEIDEKLRDDQIFYVNLHFLIGNSIDLSQMKHVRIFPGEYETYDFLAVCDVLVTDYSSVFFDFAVTKKKIVLFTYDLEEYVATRGMYFPIEDLPFPRVSDVDGLIAELNNDEVKTYEEFEETYCAYASKTVVKDILELLVKGGSEHLLVEDAPYNQKENVFIHVDRIGDVHQERMCLDYIQKLSEDKNYIVLFGGNLKPLKIDFIEKLPMKYQICGYVVKNVLTFVEKSVLRVIARSTFCEKLFRGLYTHALQREYERRFGVFRIHEFVNLSDTTQLVSREMMFLDGDKTYVELPEMYRGIGKLKRWDKCKTNYQIKHYNHHEIIKEVIVDEEYKESALNRSITFIRVHSRFRRKGNGVSYSMWFVAKSLKSVDFSKMQVIIDEKPVDAKFMSSRGIPLGSHAVLNHVNIYIDMDRIVMFPIHNRLSFSFVDESGMGVNKFVRYCRRKSRKLLFRPRILKVHGNISCYFRRTAGNRVYFTVRNYNETDRVWENFKINLAYYVSKLYRKRKIYLLFEKDSARYEESASVLYEKLIDEGYEDVYFILDKRYPDIEKIDAKYRKNIIDKYSWKHYLYFFICKTFIGTEAMIHSIELRIANDHATKKANSRENDYVFLQHGVMYMISLDSESRTFFKPRSIKSEGKFKVVTSSRLEADHFINLGGYDPTQIIISGLPKFDRNVWHEDADKIIIMPTWRAWEYNEALVNFQNCPYYKMMTRMFLAIPEQYREKVIVLPHPLFRKAAESNEFVLKKYMRFDVKYDELLRDAKVLITDYSSIAYDAFYRGANVIFYWEELEACLEEYGENTKLMLNEKNCFGDICYNAEELNQVFAENYENQQKEQYICNYKKIVTFADGKNTERVLEALKTDGIIPDMAR